jgi:very-short-patch-repair endonuclease
MATPKQTKRFAIRLSESPTRHEVMFMRKLTLAGKVSFDFQCRIGFYIVDFVFPEKMLIVEIDGGSHNDKKDYDVRRDKYLKSFGFTIWRIPNRLVFDWSVDEVINYECTEKITFQEAVANAHKNHVSELKRKRRYRRNVLSRRPPKPEKDKESLFRALAEKTENIQSLEKSRIAALPVRSIKIIKHAKKLKNK